MFYNNQLAYRKEKERGRKEDGGGCREGKKGKGRKREKEWKREIFIID